MGIFNRREVDYGDANILCNVSGTKNLQTC